MKNLGTQAAASSQVHGRYNVMSSEPNQDKRTLAINGEFAFEVSSTTPLQSGKTIYAMNAQGSRGTWYVTIQYYAHQSVSASAMQQLLQAVLDEVPT